MKIHSVIRKGDDHPVFCEDFTTYTNNGRFFLGVAFDGCSGGNESHFASALSGKIFRQVVEDGVFVGYTIEEKGKDLVKKFVDKLIDVKCLLRLEKVDLLATFMLLMYDKVHGEALVLTVGDGVIFCDGEYTILENDKFKQNYPEAYKNMPDYIAYEIDDIQLDKSYFDFWYAKYVGKNKFINPKNIAISTDGVLTFNKPSEFIDEKTGERSNVEVMPFLFEDNTWEDNKIMLSKKVNILKTRYKTSHRDDLSIIRLIINSEQDDNGNNQQG
jgi:hypothetical protein